MGELTTGVNFIAVIVGAIAAFMVGWLWYTKLFGAKWAAGNGIDMGKAGDMPMLAMGMQFLGLFLVSWFVGVTAVGSQLATLLLGVLAFVVMAASGGLYAMKPKSVILIDAGYWIVAVIVMIVAQGLL